MKILALFVLIHFFAYTMARAQESAAPAIAAAAAVKPADDCRDLLPQVEAEERLNEQKFQTLRQGLSGVQENYLIAFNQMTQLLFQISQSREEETRKISESRDLLKNSLQQFNDQKSEESSKSLQENYLNLTVLLYSGLSESQKTIETLKTHLGQVEAARSTYVNARNELEQLDQQKLALEARMVSLKIKCSPDKKY